VGGLSASRSFARARARQLVPSRPPTEIGPSSSSNFVLILPAEIADRRRNSLRPSAGRQLPCGGACKPSGEAFATLLRGLQLTLRVPARRSRNPPRGCSARGAFPALDFHPGPRLPPSGAQQTKKSSDSAPPLHDLGSAEIQIDHLTQRHRIRIDPRPEQPPGKEVIDLSGRHIIQRKRCEQKWKQNLQTDTTEGGETSTPRKTPTNKKEAFSNISRTPRIPGTHARKRATRTNRGTARLAAATSQKQP